MNHPADSPCPDRNLFLDDHCPRGGGARQCPALASVLSLVQKMPALLWTTDGQGAFTSLAGSGIEATGLAVADYFCRPVETLFSSAGRLPSPREAHLQALQGRATSFHAEIAGRELEAHLEPHRNGDGAVVGVIGVALDLTDRLVAQRGLRLSEQSYRSLIEEAPYAICRCTVDGELLLVNHAMLAMLGYPQEAELLVRDLDEVFAGTFQELRATLLERGAVNGLETAWLPRDGDLVQVLVSGRALRDPAGAVAMFDLIAEDITARKQLEEQLYQAQKMQAVGQLAGGVAHDFNNLLTVIGGQVEMILEGAEDSQLRARLARVQKAADRAGKLTRQLLAYSRRQVLQTRVVNLNTVIQHLLDLLGRLIKEHVTLDFQPAPELGWIRADPHQIEQVLINLTVNAQDAMPGGGRLTLATRNLRIGPGPGPDALEPGDYVQIIVRDNGHGMEREVQERVFEPFFTTRKFGEGTGLGLSMAYGIITQSGGAIRLESAPGEGCTFWITLPRTGPPEPGPGARPEPAAIPRGSETILLAEDEDGVRELIQDRLRGLGYTVLAAPDGLEAMAAALMYPGRIHLLLTDLVMPHADGRELAEELGKLAPKAKVIFMSGYPGHGVPGAALNLPAGHFLAKPVSLEALARTVRAVLDEKT